MIWLLRYNRHRFQISRHDRNRLRRGEWLRRGLRVKDRERRTRYDRMVATAKRQAARGSKISTCDGVPKIWDQTIGCPKCGGEAWTRPLADFDLLHPIAGGGS